MTWLRSATMKDGAVSVNGKEHEFKHGLVQVENPEDIRIFCEYLQCEVIPDEVAESLMNEAKQVKETSETKGAAKTARTKAAKE